MTKQIKQTPKVEIQTVPRSGSAKVAYDIARANVQKEINAVILRLIDLDAVRSENPDWADVCTFGFVRDNLEPLLEGLGVEVEMKN